MFWKIAFVYFELFFEIANIAQRAIESVKAILGKNHHVNKNSLIKDEKLNEKIFIVGNGPSIKSQNLENLKFENSVFVNMGFLHPLYQQISPEYHVIVDPKLANGEWDITILDEIVSLNPHVKLVLNGKWFFLDKFQRYINDDRFNIIWIKSKLFLTRFHNYKRFNISKITYGMGVMGAAISLVSHLGCKKVILLGVESNAFCSEFEAKESHFYGINKDNINPDSEKVYRSLFFNYLYLLGLHNMAVNGGALDIVNATPGGILKMFPRDDLENQLTDVEAKNEN